MLACTANNQTLIPFFNLAQTGTAILAVLVAIVTFFTIVKLAVAAVFDDNVRDAARCIARPAWLCRTYARTTISRFRVAVVTAFVLFDDAVAAFCIPQAY